METRRSLTKQFTEEGKELGYEGEALQQYVKEQKEEEERIRKEQKAEELAKLEREERIKKEDHERWKEREIFEKQKREDELELARIKESTAEKERLKGTTASEKDSEVKVKDERHRNVIDKLDKSFQNMREEEDLIGFLTLFEAVASRCNIEQKNWPLLLSYKLTMKLKTFMLQDDLFKNEDYEYVKVTLMKQANINGESCRRRFHQIKPKENDFRGYVAELRRALDNWIKMAEVDNSVEGMKDMIIKDKIMESVSAEVYRQLVLQKNDTVDCMLQVIDGFKTAGLDKTIVKECEPFIAAGVETIGNKINERKILTCFRCGKKGHKSTECYSGNHYGRYGRNISYRQNYQRKFDNNGRKVSDRGKGYVGNYRDRQEYYDKLNRSRDYASENQTAKDKNMEERTRNEPVRKR